MKEYRFEESIGYWMLSGSQAYFQCLKLELAPHGVTVRQCQVLGLIVHRGPMCQVEMAAALDIEPPGLVGVLDDMEKAELVERLVCATDRRRRLVHLMPKADDVWDIVVDAALRVRARAGKGISEEKLGELLRTLGQVVENLREP